MKEEAADTGYEAWTLQETDWLWRRLQKENRPVALYGMGDGADKILRLCGKFGISVQAVFASDEFVRGQTFAGFQVKTYAQICEEYPNPIILVAFGTEEPEVLERIYQMAERFEVLAPDIPLFGEEIAEFSWIGQHQKEIREVYEKLADETSKNVFRCMLHYKLSGKISYLRACTTPREEALQLLFPLPEEAVYVDLGAYDGDTIQEFIHCSRGRYGRILALEPDRKNYSKLQRRVEAEGLEKVELYPCAGWKEPDELMFMGKGGRNSALGTGKKAYSVPAESVDHLLQGQPASYIKMDVEGAEYETLLGSRETIQKFAPRLAVSAYHKTWDFIELACLIWSIRPEYRIYLRHHPYIPGWETNLYAI